MSRLQRLFEEVKERHPNWTKEALRYVAATMDEGSEALYESKCPKCGKEFGEHDYSFASRRFICPTK